VGFADLFTRPTWSNVLVLLAGAILAPGRRTVSALLRILGRECDPDFCTFHRILNRSAWSPRGVARQLLCLLVKVLVPVGAPVVIGIDDTIERRWGAKISARGIYRDPVRSSKGHFVKASGLRWLSAMLLVRVPWADRVMALPFLTLLAPSKRFYSDKTRAPKTLLDWARQAALQIHRWLPDRYIVLVGDSAFAAIEFLAAVRNYVCVITRLRLDANLFDFPPQKRKGRGRRKPSAPPISTLDPATFSAGSSVAGRSRSHLQKFELISAWKPNVNGQTKQSFAARQSCSACSRSSRSGHTIFPNHESSSREPPHGIQRRS